MRVRVVKDEEDVWIEVQLNHTKNFFQRVVAAVKYIFGYESRFGHWDCTILSEEEQNKLMKFLNDN
jgi:hypothetical protein